MTTTPLIRNDAMTPGILSNGGNHRRSRPAETGRRPRFVTESHALGAKSASPRSLFIAATVAVALYLIGRRLSG